MMLRIGDRLPDAVFTVMGPEGPELRTTDDIFAGRAVAMFALPGAYTPVCHKQHLPGIIELSSELKRKGIDTVACTAVNDIYVLNEWGNCLGANGSLLMLADGNGEFALKAGLAMDLSRFGLGIRSMRYAMLVDNGVVTLLSIEDDFGTHDKSSAATLSSLIDNAA